MPVGKGSLKPIAPEIACRLGGRDGLGEPLDGKDARDQLPLWKGLVMRSSGRNGVRMAASCPLGPKACPSAGSARTLAARLAPTHAFAWARTGNPELGEGPPAVLVRTGIIPDEYEAGGGLE